MKTYLPRRRRRGDFSTQFGAFLLLVLFPAAFTAVSPRNTVHLQRDGDGVRVAVCAHTLFFIPYWCQHERGVRRVELEFSLGERLGYNAQMSEHANQVHRRGDSADNAVIHFLGAGDGASAMIEVGRMDAVLAQVQRFIDDRGSGSLRLSFFGHRGLGLYVGGLLSLLVLLWLPLAGLAIVRRALGRPLWPFDA